MTHVTRTSPVERRSKSRRGLRCAVVLAAMLLVAACASAEDDATALRGLITLTARADGSTGLVADLSGDDGVITHEVRLPGSSTSWVAAGRDGTLAATLADGTLHVSDRLVPGSAATLDWRAVVATDPSGDAPAGPFWFPSWDPEGGRLAALAGDLLTGGDVDVVLIDPTTSTAFTITLDDVLRATPPAWLGADALAVGSGTSESPGIGVIDTTNGDARPGPAGVRRFASSADGMTVAVADTASSAVTIHETAGWLAGTGTSLGSVARPSAEASLASLALDRDGARLAVAWLLQDGRVQVNVHDRADGWRTVAGRTSDDGARGAVVGWLR